MKKFYVRIERQQVLMFEVTAANVNEAVELARYAALLEKVPTDIEDATFEDIDCQTSVEYLMDLRRKEEREAK
jgi:hypothetical protein